MESKQIKEGGDSSDSDVFDNWTIIDTEEAHEAIILDEKNREEEQTFEEAQSSPDLAVSEEADLPKDDSANLPDIEDQRNEDLTEPGCDLSFDSDDGVSIITDSEPEELVPPPSYGEQYLTSKLPHRRFSEHSNDYFDQSDMTSFQELPEDLGHQGDRKYVHHPNQKLNLVLNGLVIICIASVVGLGVGHFLGLQEECPYSQADGVRVSLEDVAPDTKSLLAKLEAENDLLKSQLWQLQQGIQDQAIVHSYDQSLVQIADVKQGWETTSEINAEPEWDLLGAVADPDHHTEPAGVVWSAGLALADNPGVMFSQDHANGVSEEHLSDETHGLQVQEEKSAMLETAAGLPSTTDTNEEAKSNDKVQPQGGSQYEEIQFPYTDEDLEIIQTRFARETPNQDRKEDGSGKEKRDNKKTYNSFFSKMEAELNGVMNHVLHYSSNFVKTHNVKKHVATSIDILSSTLQDMQVKVKSLSESTAQHSIHAMDKVTKSVYKMVQKVKHASNDILKRQHESGSISNKVIKGVNNLKDGLVSNWCHLKKKMALGSGEQDEVCRLQSKRHSDMERNRQQNYGDKTNLHHDSSFKAKSTDRQAQGYVDKKNFGLKMKQNKSASHHKNKHYSKEYQKNGFAKKYHDKHYKAQTLPKNSINEYKMKERQENSKQQYQNSRLRRQEWKERVWKLKEELRDECSKDENCSITDGEWMERLAEARAHQRQAEHKSDWMFERARARQERREGEREEEGSWFLRRGRSREQGRGDHVLHQGYSGPWANTRNF